MPFIIIKHTENKPFIILCFFVDFLIYFKVYKIK